MATQVRFVDKLQLRLVKLGLSKRKATVVAGEVAPTAQRAKVSGTVTSKLVAKLLALGMTERKAVVLAKGLAPTVRANIKAKVKAAERKLAEVEDAEVNAEVVAATDGADDAALDAVAPRVNGHRVGWTSRWCRGHGGGSRSKGIELLRVMVSTVATISWQRLQGCRDRGGAAVGRNTTASSSTRPWPTGTSPGDGGGTGRAGVSGTRVVRRCHDQADGPDRSV